MPRLGNDVEILSGADVSVRTDCHSPDHDEPDVVAVELGEQAREVGEHHEPRSSSIGRSSDSCAQS